MKSMQKPIQKKQTVVGSIELSIRVATTYVISDNNLIGGGGGTLTKFHTSVSIKNKTACNKKIQSCTHLTSNF